MSEKQNNVEALVPWIRMLVTVVLTTVASTVAVITYVNANFVTRAEWNSHDRQQQKEMGEIVRTQEAYAGAERGTAGHLGQIDSRLAGIESDVGWLKQYLLSHQAGAKIRGE